jgi:hypothetical protein
MKKVLKIAACVLVALCIVGIYKEIINAQGEMLKILVCYVDINRNR